MDNRLMIKLELGNRIIARVRGRASGENDGRREDVIFGEKEKKRVVTCRFCPLTSPPQCHVIEEGRGERRGRGSKRERNGRLSDHI